MKKRKRDREAKIDPKLLNAFVKYHRLELHQMYRDYLNDTVAEPDAIEDTISFKHFVIYLYQEEKLARYNDRDSLLNYLDPDTDTITPPYKLPQYRQCYYCKKVVPIPQMSRVDTHQVCSYCVEKGEEHDNTQSNTSSNKS